ncbi:MAG: hypothetical protein JSW61_04375 [Candidatus Thorarchaeota archaeon]|nr:MAG: hypothetical protein JSW61_04375 [Candidatus Thorarchaeota archaeon]
MAWPEDEPAFPTHPSDRPRTMSQLETNSLFALLLQFISGFMLVTNFGLGALLVIAVLPYVGTIADPLGLALLLALPPFGIVQILYAWMMYSRRSGSGRMAVVVDFVVIVLLAINFIMSDWSESSQFLLVMIGINAVAILLLTMTSARQNFYDI